VFDTPRRLGRFDDTLVLFFSDNGGCAEPMRAEGWGKFYPSVTSDGRKIDIGNRTDIRPGGPGSFMSCEQAWANVSNTPFRLFKHYVHESGISTPLWSGKPRRRQQPIFWEHEGNAAARVGNLKLVRQLDRPWEMDNPRG
jgi:arylsulfatase A-like enzyme